MKPQVGLISKTVQYLGAVIFLFLMQSCAVSNNPSAPEIGVNPSRNQSAIWNLPETRIAAEQGNVKAQFDLGGIYFYGRNVEQNDKLAFEWFRKAALQGYAEGQNQLGWMYLNGRGVDKDETNSFEWHRKSALQGYSLGQFRVAQLYENGVGVPKNLTLAYFWYSINTKAVRDSNPTSKTVLQYADQAGWLNNELTQKVMEAVAEWKTGMPEPVFQ